MIGYITKGYKKFKEKKYEPQSVRASLFKGSYAWGVGSEEDNMLEFDLIMSESHGLEFKASDHVIENGQEITDHITRQLRSVTVKGMFTNHPVGGVIYDTKDEEVEAVDYMNDYDQINENLLKYNRAKKNIDLLEELAEKKETVRIVTCIRVYPEMIITSIKYDRNPKDGSAVYFTLTLREVKFADVKIFKSLVKLNEYKVNKNKLDNKILTSTKNDAGQVTTISKETIAGLETYQGAEITGGF